MTVALVTGAGGQDGRYLTRALVAEGVIVHGVVRPGTAVEPGVIAHEVDLVVPGAGAAVLTGVGPDVVVNLAGMSSVARSWEDPQLNDRINADLPAELLAAAAQTGCRFVQASSSELFGQAEESPQSETTPIRPVSPYGRAKARAHELVGRYRADGLPASSAILFSHESPLRPERFITRKISAAAARMARGSRERLAVGALDARRDWGWAPDYVLALRAMAVRPGDYVIATGVDHSVEDFARIAFEHAGVRDWRSRLEPDAALLRPADPVSQVGDATKARTVLGWRPTMRFEEVVVAMVDADLAALGR